MTPRLFALRSAVLLFAASAAVSFAQVRTRKEPAVQRGPFVPAVVDKTPPPSRGFALARPATLGMGPLSAVERAKLGPVGLKERIGVHRSVTDGSLDQGTWAQLPNGDQVWRLAIQSDGAAGLRVQFSNFSVAGGKVWVHTATSVDGPYTDRGPYGNGEFWSGTVEGESMTIEYQPASGANATGTPQFHVHRVAHQIATASTINPRFGGRGAGTLFSTNPDPAATCNLDVNCYPDWQSSKQSVAQIEFEETAGPEQGTFLCSASAVATRDNSFTPYLLTAGHCIHDEDAARSLQTFWAYESIGCNLGPGPDRGTLNSPNGGHLLAWATIQTGDYSLVLLPSIPSGVVFSGWDPQDPAENTPVTGISHPEGGYKRISFGHTVPGVDVFVGSDFAPGDLYDLVQYDLGITQPGSSGSPIFIGPGVIVGTLTYGPDLPGEQLCNAGADLGGYGKFSTTYNDLQDFFEDLPFSQVTPSTTQINFSGQNHAISGKPSQTFTLTTQSASPVQFVVRPDLQWLTVTPATGTVSAAAPVKVQVTVNPQYFTQTDVYAGTLSIFSGTAPPMFVNISVSMVINTSNVVVSSVPNPVPSTQNGAAWQLTLVLHETNGSPTTLTGLRIDGADYSANIPGFFGTTKIPANGSIQGTIHTGGLIPPVTKFFEFYGTDRSSGQTWYRQLEVTFTN